MSIFLSFLSFWNWFFFLRYQLIRSLITSFITRFSDLKITKKNLKIRKKNFFSKLIFYHYHSLLSLFITSYHFLYHYLSLFSHNLHLLSTLPLLFFIIPPYHLRVITTPLTDFFAAFLCKFWLNCELITVCYHLLSLEKFFLWEKKFFFWNFLN